MSLDVARLSLVTNPSVDLDSRCRSIARNAVQAAREAHGRGDALYTDDEAKRESMIEKILHLEMSKYEDNDVYAPLVAAIQPIDPVINKALDVLEKGIETELMVTALPVADTVKSTNNKPKN